MQVMRGRKPLLPPGATYAGRRSTAVVKVLTIDRDAAALLEQYSGRPGNKKQGDFVSRLLYEHHSRMEEKTRLAAVLAES